MTLLAISVAPSGTQGTSLSDYVAKAIKVAREDSRVKMELGPMFTILEGELEDVFDVAKKMHQVMVDAGAPRISTVIKIDDRRDKEHSMQSKLESVLSKLEN